jgi:hypothetical protein
MADYDKLKDDNSSQDGLSFQGWAKKDVSYKDILLRQIETCRIEGSKQKISGGKFYMQDKDGNYNQVELFDQRRIYIQCVLSLHDLMLRYFDDEVEKKTKQIQTDIEAERKKIWENYLQTENSPRARFLAKSTNAIQMTTIGRQFIDYFEGYRYNKHRELFQELLVFYHRKQEFSGKRTAGIY